MHFSIITPSYNQRDYLKQCIASVRDQIEAVSQQPLANSKELGVNSSISVHHHVQDGGSTDGSREFVAEHQANSQQLLAKSYTFTYESAPDNGMYEAINKGVAFVGTGLQGSGIGEKPEANSHKRTANRPDSIVAWLNCDEQYLPGTLDKVAEYFKTHPETDILFGGMLMVDTAGELLACRKAMPMRKSFLEASYLYNYSCAMFFRKSLWDKLGGFDPSFKNAGDEDLVRRALKLNAKCYVLSDYLSVFTYSSNNLSSGGGALEEHEALKRSSSWCARVLKLPINLARLAEKAARGGLIQQGPVEYAIYGNDPSARTRFRADHPSCKWPDHSKPYLAAHRLKGSDRR
jgi:glycosyltransferase involved in cell wall biosynthesis